MNLENPDEVLSRLPVFAKRKYDWALVYPLINLLSEQHAKISKDQKTDITSDVFLYAAYAWDTITKECQPVVTAGQVDCHSIWCTSLEVHAKHSSDMVRLLDLIGQPFALDLRRKLFFHCMNSNAGEVLLPPMYLESLKDAVPTACPTMIARCGETPVPRLVNDVGPESWPRAWKLNEGSKPFDAWPDHVRGKALDLREWSWEPSEQEVALPVKEVAYNAFLFVLRSSEEQVDLRALIEDQVHADTTDKAVPCVCVTSADWKDFACVMQLDDLLVLSVWTHDTMARTSSKKWCGGQRLSDLLQDCLQRFYFPSLPTIDTDGRVQPW